MAVAAAKRLEVFAVDVDMVQVCWSDLPSGAHAAHWDGIDERGRKLASGVYHIRAEAGSEKSSQSIVLMK